MENKLLDPNAAQTKWIHSKQWRNLLSRKNEIVVNTPCLLVRSICLCNKYRCAWRISNFSIIFTIQNIHRFDAKVNGKIFCIISALIIINRTINNRIVWSVFAEVFIFCAYQMASARVHIQACISLHFGGSGGVECKVPTVFLSLFFILSPKFLMGKYVPNL